MNERPAAKWLHKSKVLSSREEESSRSSKYSRKRSLLSSSRVKVSKSATMPVERLEIDGMISLTARENTLMILSSLSILENPGSSRKVSVSMEIEKEHQ